jgi:hypothetical protein
LLLEALPFPEGQAVEVTVVPRAKCRNAPEYPLRGNVKRFDRPTDSIAEAEWEANQ